MILSGYSSLINEITTESFFERSNLKGGRFMPVGTTLLDSQASTMLLYDNQQQSQEKYKMCAWNQSFKRLHDQDSIIYC